MKKIWALIFAIGIVTSSVIGVTYGFVEDTQELQKPASGAEAVASGEETHCCEYYDGKYYGSSCSEVSENDYIGQCIGYSCEEVGGVYYDEAGKKVDKQTYQIECETNICKQIGNRYFGKDAKEVNEETYISQCQIYKCEEVNGKYYNEESKEVTKELYEAQCIGAVTSPQTGIDFKPFMVLVGIGALAIVLRKRLKNILYKV